MAGKLPPQLFFMGCYGYKSCFSVSWSWTKGSFV